MSDYGSVTQCPKCGTSFHVGPAQLEAAKGRVRCGGCLNVFVAKEHFIVEQKPLFDNSTTDKVPTSPSVQRANSTDDFNNTEKEETFFNTRAEENEELFSSQTKQWRFSDSDSSKGLDTDSKPSLVLKPSKEPEAETKACLLYTSPSPRDRQKSRMPSSA